MRLPEKIVVDLEETFGELKFSAERRENFVEDEEGNLTGEVKKRVYDLKSKVQGMMIQVSIPETAGKKEFPYNALVTLVNPNIYAIANTRYNGNSAVAEWHLEADDIVPASGEKAAEPGKQPPVKPGAAEQVKPEGDAAAGKDKEKK